MRILQLNSGCEINGAVIHTYLLTRELVRLGHEVTVICRPGSCLIPRLEELGVPCWESTMERRPAELRRMAHAVRREQFEVLHTHMSRAHMFGLLLRAATGTPCVATAHHRLFQLHWWLNDFVIANSDATRKFHIRFNRVHPSRIKTVYCAPDLQKFASVQPGDREVVRQRYGLQPDQALIGVVGQVVRRKGQQYLLRALPEILSARPDARVMLVGAFDRQSTYTRRLRDFLTGHRLYRRVIWAGNQSDVPGFMAAMDVCVVPSLEEPLGLVALEAQATAVPLIVSDAGGLTEIVTHEQDGLVVRRGDPAAIAAGVLRLLEDHRLAAELVACGRRRALERFSLGRLSGDVADVLQQVARKRRSAA